MPLTRATFDFTYRSGSGGAFYYFTISMDVTGQLSVRNIQTPTGRIIDSQTGLPQEVANDIQTALEQVEDLVAQTSAVNGTLTFAGETQQAVVFATPFAGTNYRVLFSPSEFVPVRAVNKTTTGFTVDVGVTYTGTIGFDVFV